MLYPYWNLSLWYIRPVHYILTVLKSTIKFLLRQDLVNVLQVIIDSQPLTVAVLASLLFGESIGYIGAAGLVLGVIGLLLLEVIMSAVS